jgi:DNA topoisomerase I
MGFSLVIVESPAKCKKIEQYLGPGYKCVASFGHFRTLDGLQNIDISNNFHPTYVIGEKKQRQVNTLKKLIDEAEEVILATDDDREGEAISWHICDYFGLPIESTKRIIFHEITEDALQRAVAHPKLIDMNMVYSQQARQILDLLVGFTISPVLWKHISKNSDASLSAGRCQTPALRLIYDNYLKIKEQNSRQIYSITGYFTSNNLAYKLDKEFETEEETKVFLNANVSYNHIYSVSKPKLSYKSPPEPLTTSSLQQLASTNMKISPKECMKLAQELYEHGYITYMRTDSKKYSKEFIESSKTFITNKFNDAKYVRTDIDNLQVGSSASRKSSRKPNKNAPPPQEAHEAIRPVNVSLTIIENKDITAKAIKLYKLIWERSVESCMSKASFNIVVSKISSPLSDAFYIYEASKVIFKGWTALKAEKEQTNYYDYLQSLKQDTIVKYNKLIANVRMRGLQDHYKEAELVKELETLGIGRPSTFSSLVDKIQERDYVEKKDIDGTKCKINIYELENGRLTERQEEQVFGNEKNVLVLTNTGLIVIEYLINKFDTIFNYGYTKEMEDKLDIVSKGNKVWHELCRECYQEIQELLENVKNDSKFEIKINEHHKLIIAKHGPVIVNNESEKPKFIPVRKDLDIANLPTIIKLDDIILKEENPVEKMVKLLGHYKGEKLYLKKGKYGLYVEWGEGNKKSLKEFGNRPLENIDYEEVLVILEKEEGILNPEYKPGIIREVSTNISIRNGKYGDYIYYKPPKVKTPKFFKLQGFTEDYKKCSIYTLRSWIKQQHQIE